MSRYKVLVLYSSVVMHILLISAYSLIKAYCFVGLNVHCKAHFTYKCITNKDLAQHRHLNTSVLVQGSNMQELVEIATCMSTFDSHILHEVGAFLS